MIKWYNKGHGSGLSLVGGQVYLYIDKVDARKKDPIFTGRCTVSLKVPRSTDESAVKIETIRQTCKVLLAALADLERKERDV